MTPEDRSVIMSLVTVPGQGRPGSPEEVLRHFQTTDGKDLGIRLLQDASERRDGEDLEFALIVCDTFGSTPSLELLSELSAADWHESHEDVVGLLDRLRTPRAIGALTGATEWVPDYLDWDENRALARKAVWAIGKIPGPEAEAALERLLKADDEIVREEAATQIERRSS